MQQKIYQDKKQKKGILWSKCIPVLLLLLGCLWWRAGQGKAEPALDAENLADGVYQVAVTLSGGTGRATIESPAELTVKEGEAKIRLIWSSPYYDYMIVEGQKWEAVNTEGNSEFQIPVTSFDSDIPVVADTIAMSVPHEIDYTLRFDSATLQVVKDNKAETGAENEKGGAETEVEEAAEPASETTIESNTNDVETQTGPMQNAAAQGKTDTEAKKTELPGLTWERALPLAYARNFTVEYYEGGYCLISILESGRLLLVPEGMEAPEGLETDIVVLHQPVANIYLVATSAMDFFAALDGLDAIRLSGTDTNGWYVEEAKTAMEEGRILYAGKYSAPDYEQILAQNCGLCIESTMIYHTPEVKEKLEGFGIPVMVERSSYEEHPLGRAEWVKLYGALLGKEELAEQLFEAQAEKLQEVEQQEKTGSTVAFFYISSNGYVSVRKSGDYISKMIDLAGGTYIFPELGDTGDSLSTVNMQMEDFYAGAKEADYLIYNSAIDGEIQTIAELLQKSELLADFKAVKEGHVWCTTQNLFQKTTGLADLIVDIHTVLTREDAQAQDCTYLYPLK